MEEDGVYCSTAGVAFNSREDMQEHYQSEFHRYNLKRKVAGLPPVTREWYEARREQLAASAAGTLQRVWLEPLTKKKFYSENTYQAFTRSKKYQELVKKSGQPAPAVVVSVRRINAPETAATPEPAKPAAAKPAGFSVKPAVRGGAAKMDANNAEAEEGGSDWETASDDDEVEDAEAAANEAAEPSAGAAEEEQEEWVAWDVCRSLFDNRVSPSMEANLEYMWKYFGFYLPDSEFLTDPAGLLQYLGAKLQYGHVALYESGSNPHAKQFSSLHAVQRHMVDCGRCKPLYDGNEDEYEEFYDYGDEGEDGMAVHGEEAGASRDNRALALAEATDAVAGGFELAVPTAGGGVRLLGTREFAQYYRQRHRAGDLRESAAAARVVAAYRKLSVPLLGDGSEGLAAAEKKRTERAVRRAERARIGVSIRRNVNDNLPRNVPY